MNPLHPHQVEQHHRLAFQFGLAFNGPFSYGVQSEAAVRLSLRAADALEADLRVLMAYLEANLAGLPVPYFPLAEQLLAERQAGVPQNSPFFSGRFDVVMDKTERCWVIELNADRNGMQRESMADPLTGAAFRQRYLAAVKQQWETCGDPARTPHTAILIAPAYREEQSLAPFLARTIQHGLGWPCEVAGIDNLMVDAAGHVRAFGERVDLIIRQYPTEYFAEGEQAAAVVQAYLGGKVLVINAFRAVILQAKNWLATASHAAWYAPETLSPDAVRVIRERIPFTATLDAPVLPVDPADPLGAVASTAAVLKANPAQWVLKPTMGRYSWGVTCGALVPPDEWQDALRSALASPDYWIAQRYVPPRQESLVRWQHGQQQAVPGYVNFGVHVLGGELAGWAARCSASPVTDDAWFARVELR